MFKLHLIKHFFQERFFTAPHWKLPGGYVDPGNAKNVLRKQKKPNIIIILENEFVILINL